MGVAEIVRGGSSKGRKRGGGAFYCLLSYGDTSARYSSLAFLSNIPKRHLLIFNSPLERFPTRRVRGIGGKEGGDRKGSTWRGLLDIQSGLWMDEWME